MQSGAPPPTVRVRACGVATRRLLSLSAEALSDHREAIAVACGDVRPPMSPPSTLSSVHLVAHVSWVFAHCSCEFVGHAIRISGHPSRAERKERLSSSRNGRSRRCTWIMTWGISIRS
eukprot:778662-Pyramimonas_sp.AAC.1